MITKEKLLFVVNPESIHVGGHLVKAANTLSIDFRLCDMREAFDANIFIAKINWIFRGHYPSNLRIFSREVVALSRQFKPKWLLATGLAPIDREALSEIGKLGVERLNYLTDDPWNIAHKSSWFTETLPMYDHIFTPRTANIQDLRMIGCRSVSCLPFAYAPEEHFPQTPAGVEEQTRFSFDVVFAGCADQDRVPYISAMVKNGFKVGLYGGYWERFTQTRSITHGQADSATLRKVISSSKVALCLVRRSNRDGNSMRTFEIPAIGACMLTEDTPSHREIFGEEGKAVIYFTSVAEMISKLRWLLDRDDERKRMARAAYDLIVKGKNTYKDRLEHMLTVKQDMALKHA